jgi:glycosidase
MDPASNLSMVTRPRSTPLLSGVRTKRGMRHVWTTFSNDQIDLNYANPDVLLEFIDLLLYYIRRGARMIRLDAVAYLWKQPGTRCIHLPQTHQVVKLFRDVLDEVEPSGLIMTETNVPHVENIGYFGDGDEAHLVYQFSLPPLLLHALFSGDGRYLNDWAEQLESQQLPPGCTYLNFTASHDGIGLRPLEGLLPPAELEALLAAMRERGGYISSRANRDGSVSPYELNISYFDAFREPDGSLQRQIRMFLLAQLISLSLKGIPAVYLHSLTATGNDAEGVERTGMTRAINRRKWDRGELEGLIANPDSATGQVFARYRALLALRRAQPAFHPDADQRLLRLDDRLFCCERTAPQGQQRILVLANLAPDPVSLAATALSYDPERLDDLLAIARLETGPTGFLVPGHAIFWWQVAS